MKRSAIVPSMLGAASLGALVGWVIAEWGWTIESVDRAEEKGMWGHP